MSSTEDTSLQECLLWICRHHGVERSATSLFSGHALSQPPTSEEILRVLQEVGMQGAWVQRELPAILDLVLPCVLIMQGGQACILTRRLPGGTALEEPGFETVWPHDDQQTRVVAHAKLKSQYSGKALFVSRPAPNTVVPETAQTRTVHDHWLWSTLLQFAPYYRSSMLAASLSNVLMLVAALFSSVVFDRILPHKAIVTLWTMAIGVGFALVFDMVARQIRTYLIDLAGKKTDLALAAKLFRQALMVRLEHRPTSAGAFGHRLGQIELVREFSTSATLTVVSDVPFVVLFIAMTFFIAGPLGWVPLVAVPLILLISWGTQTLLRRHMTDNLHQQAHMQGVLVEAMEGIEDVRASGSQGHFFKHYDLANAIAAESSLRARALSGGVNNFVMVSQQLIVVIILVWGVHLIKDGVISSGALVAAMMFAGRATAPLVTLLALASRFQAARAALQDLNRLMELPTDRIAGKNYVARPQMNGALALRDISFAYPQSTSGHAPVVLKEVNLQIRSGERVAILGRIGSGKSTLLRLMAGLYLPTNGMVEADGLDVRQIDPADFRAHIGFVSQDPRLFSGTLKDNILLGRPNASAESFLEVLKLTGLDRFAASHPLGLDLQVGEMGGLLSGGQRQMVALARCLVVKPKVLLLDEPTSSMDGQTEMAFVRHLRDAMGDRTLLIVTHRPALLDLVNRIVVMEEGRVVADGPKSEVLKALASRTVAA